MPFDALTVAAVRQELKQKIVEGRVQGVLVPAPLSVALEIYRAGVGRSHLLLSAHPQHARIHLLPKAPSRDPEQQPPLLLLLRKYVRGGTITDVYQPPGERVLVLSIVKRLLPSKHQEYHSDPYFMDSPDAEDEEEAGPEVPLTQVQLIIEAMSRLSNIVLLEDDGTVMDGIKRIPSSINRYRVTLPHHPYVLPPPQEKRDPRHSTLNALALELFKVADVDEKAAAWKGLVSGLSGVSPALAREAVFRALGSTTAKAAEVGADPMTLAKVKQQLLELLDLEFTGAWEHVVAWGGPEGARKALDFAPYLLHHLEAQGATLVRYKGISEAAAEYFAQAGTMSGHIAVRETVREQLAEVRSRDERRLSALQEQVGKAASADQLRLKGESIFAYMHTLQPGQRTLVVPDENLKIELDLDLTPVENAQAYFKEYHKARSALEGLPEMISEAEMRIGLLDEIATSLDIASTLDEIRAVQSELTLVKYPAGRKQPEAEETVKQKGKKSRKPQEKLPQPIRLQTSRGVQVLVGRTSRQNDVATFRLATPDDLWFHARGVPGAHVILRTGGGEVTEDDIREAAELAAGYSKARENSQADVLYTERRLVRKVPNSPPGFVTYKSESVIRVAPRRITKL